VRTMMFASLWYNTTRVLLTQPVGFADVNGKERAPLTGFRLARGAQ